jgi:hypothetical protein
LIDNLCSKIHKRRQNLQNRPCCFEEHGIFRDEPDIFLKSLLIIYIGMFTFILDMGTNFTSIIFSFEVIFKSFQAKKKSYSAAFCRKHNQLSNFRPIFKISIHLRMISNHTQVFNVKHNINYKLFNHQLTFKRRNKKEWDCS